jgi:hypothetical protein
MLTFYILLIFYNQMCLVLANKTKSNKKYTLYYFEPKGQGFLQY